jgi:hypothetical protein
LGAEGKLVALISWELVRFGRTLARPGG